jgi:hypothetical protein
LAAPFFRRLKTTAPNKKTGRGSGRLSLCLKQPTNNGSDLATSEPLFLSTPLLDLLGPYPLTLLLIGGRLVFEGYHLRERLCLSFLMCYTTQLATQAFLSAPGTISVLRVSTEICERLESVKANGFLDLRLRTDYLVIRHTLLERRRDLYYYFHRYRESISKVMASDTNQQADFESHN